ncbi:MAG: hypothetical protein K2K63_04525 [Acetatifactor sp.]|nr:hypothetical protein [Acetatifactor sp.]
MKKKSLFCLIIAVFGIALIVSAMVLDGKVSDAVDGTLTVAGEVLQWTVLAAAWAAIFLDAPLWVMLAAGCPIPQCPPVTNPFCCFSMPCILHWQWEAERK